MSLDDQGLWARFCAAPDECHFAELYERYRALVWTLSWRMLGNEEDALDAFQAAWARLFELARSEGARLATEPADRIVYQCSIREADNLKKRRNRRSRRELAMELLPQVAAGDLPADERMAGAERRGRLESIIAMLPEKYRLPIQLHYLHGLSQLEIARMTGISRNTIATRLARGLRKLAPLAERAGLGELAGLLAAAALGGGLLAPPSALAAPVVFAQLQSLLAGGAAANVGGLAGSLLAKLSGVGGFMMQAKSALLGAAAALALATGIYLNSDAAEDVKPLQATEAAVATPAAPAPAESPAPAATPPPAAKEPPAAAPTPVSAPDEPTRELQMMVHWTRGRGPIEGMDISVTARPERSRSYRVNNMTDAEGMIRMQIPQSWDQLTARGLHPEAVTSTKNFSINDPSPVRVYFNVGGTVYGMVRDRQGEPVAGATIRSYMGHSGYVGQTETKTDGSFELPKMPAGSTRVVATHGEETSEIRSPTAGTITVVEKERVGPVNLVIEPGATITGRVIERNSGLPISGARIKVANEASWRNRSATTDQEGIFQLNGIPLRQLTIEATSKHYAGQQRVVEPSLHEPNYLEFELDPGAEIHVSVLDEAGEPVAEASLSAGDSNNRSSATTDANGRATLRNLPVDRPATVHASKEGWTTVRSNPVRWEAGPSEEVTLRLSRADLRPGHFIGTVTGPDGQPLPDVTVNYGYFSITRWGERTTTDPAGNYQLMVKDGSSQDVLTAHSSSWATQRKPAKPGTADQPTRVDFQMASSHWIGGTVVDEQDRPIEHATVHLGMHGPQGMDYLSLPATQSYVRTDAQGRFHVEGLPEGQLNLSVSAHSFADQTEKVKLDQEVKLTLKTTGIIRARVVDKRTGEPVRSVSIRIVDRHEQAGQAFSNNEGRYTLSGFRQGDRPQLVVESRGYATASGIEAVADAADAVEELTIELTRGQPLRGLLVDGRNGDPVGGALVIYGSVRPGWDFNWMREDDRNYGLIELGRAVTKPDGRFEFSVQDHEQTLYIQPREHARLISDAAARKLQQLADGTYRIPLQPGASLSGHLLLAGKPQADSNVSLNATDERNHQHMSAQTDAHGRFELRGLTAGNYTLHGGLIWNEGTGIYTMSRRLELKEGERCELNLGDGLGDLLLFGMVLDGGEPVSKAHITLRPLFDWDYQSISGWTDEDGIYTIDGLRPGRYRASVSQHTEAGRRNFSHQEEVEVREIETQHIFERAKRYQVTARLVFDQGVSDDFKASLRQARLQISEIQNGQISFTNLDMHGQAEVQDGRISFTGRFQGEYGISLHSGAQPLRLPGSFRLDNLKGDQDLGELRVPAHRPAAADVNPIKF